MGNKYTFLTIGLSLFVLLCPGPAVFSQSDPVNQASPESAAATAGNSDSLLIKNATLIGRQGVLEDAQVNILIVDGRLMVVTQDEITAVGITTFDAGMGFLMGNLVIGNPPSFIILDQDPRENVEVMLNTADHVLFAMDQGVIIENELAVISEPPPQPRPRIRLWTAYSPPPIAIPLNYFDSRKWNKFETKIISGLFNGAIAMDRLWWLSQDAASETQVGDLSVTSVGEIRAIRFGLIGTLNFKNPWTYTFFITNGAFDRGFDASTDKKFVLYDLRLDIPLLSWMNLSIGKQKEPISMERLSNLLFLPLQERPAALDAYLPARNYGIVLNGTVLGQRVSWATGIFKNWVDSKESFSDTPIQWTSRISGLPLLNADESSLLHLGLALRYSGSRQELIGKTEAEFYEAPVFVEADPIPTDFSLTYNGEVYLRSGPLLLGFEYTALQVRTPNLVDSWPDGFHISGSWILTGEMRSYRKRSGIFDPVPVAHPINQGGWGALEAALRYSRVDLTEGELNGGTMNTYSFGLNWWMTSRIEFSLNYRYITLDRFSITGTSSGLNFRLKLLLD